MTPRSGSRGRASALGAISLALAVVGAAAPAELAVVARDGRVDVSAQAAPVSEVLDRIAVVIGATLEYAGAPPRGVVTLNLVGRTPTDALTTVLEGVNHALVTDAAGTRVVKIVVAADSAGPDEEPPAPPAHPLELGGPPLREILEGLMDEAGKAGDEAVPDEPEALPDLLQSLMDKAAARANLEEKGEPRSGEDPPGLPDSLSPP